MPSSAKHLLAIVPDLQHTNLYKVSGLHSNRFPLSHAVSEPADVQNVHDGQILHRPSF